MEREASFLKGKEISLSPPTPSPACSSSSRTYHMHFALEFASISFSISQLWLRPGGVCVHSVSSHKKVLNSVLAHTC